MTPRELAHQLHPVQMAVCDCDGGVTRAPGAWCAKVTAILTRAFADQLATVTAHKAELETLRAERDEARDWVRRMPDVRSAFADIPPKLCKYCVGKELRAVCVKCGRAPRAGAGTPEGEP